MIDNNIIKKLKKGKNNSSKELKIKMLSIKITDKHYKFLLNNNISPTKLFMFASKKIGYCGDEPHE